MPNLARIPLSPPNADNYEGCDYSQPFLFSQTSILRSNSPQSNLATSLLISVRRSSYIFRSRNFHSVSALNMKS